MAQREGAEPLLYRRLLRNTSSNLLGTTVTLGAGFFLTPFILNQLGPASFGLWILVGSVVNYGRLLNFGITDALTKYVAGSRVTGESDETRRLVSSSLFLYMAFGLAVVAIIACFAPFFPAVFGIAEGERTTALRLVVLMGVFVGLSIPSHAPTSILRGLDRFDVINALDVVSSIASTIGIVVVLLLGGGVIGLVAVHLTVMLLMQIPSYWFIMRFAPDLRIGWRWLDYRAIRSVLSFGSSVFIISMGERLQTKTDEVIIGAMITVVAVTPYAIARRLTEIGRTFVEQFLKVLLPIASEMHAEGSLDRLRSFYVTSTRMTLAISIPLGSAVVFLSAPFLALWVGAEYAHYGHLVALLMLAAVINMSQRPATSVFQAMGRHRPLAIGALSAGVANVGLSLALVKPFGLTGVALGTVIAVAGKSLGFVFPYSMRVLGIRASEAITQILLPALLPAVPMAVFLYISTQQVQPQSFLEIAVIGGGSALLYGVGYLAVGAREIERQTYYGFLLGSIRIARARLRRS